MLAALHQRLRNAVSEQILLLIYAAVIGIGGGYGAVGFRKLIDLSTWAFYGKSQIELASYTGYRTFFMPAIGGLLVGLLVYFFAREAKGHGVPEVMFAVSEKKGIIRPRIVIAKALASALTIGSGGSVGREGPIVQIGSAWGSFFGQLLHMNEKQLKTLVACGAAAGIAGTFNAPIGGALFASEIILGSFEVANISAIVIASVLSAAIGRYALGNIPAFPIPHYEVSGIPALFLFMLLGIVGGLFAVSYIRVLLFFELLWDRLTKLKEWVKPAIGGIILGLVGHFYPQILGVGYPTVEKALANHLSISLLLILLVLKLLMTSTTIASGGSGGVFAPGLYMGAMLGGAFGLIVHSIFPGLPVSEGVFAVAGMAAVFAGTAHAPITAMIMLFEMTNNYQLILPLMLATVFSTTISMKLHRESIYTMKLKKRGFDIIRKRAADRLSSILVGESMHPEKLSLHASITLNQAIESFSSSEEWFAYVRDDKQQLLGSISKSMIFEEIGKGNGDRLISDLLPTDIPDIPEHATVGEASRLLTELNAHYLLVRNAKSEYIGIIGNSDIVKAYKLAQ